MSGHGSRGIGALTTAGPGVPGENGEWISLSNRCMPPLGNPSTLNVGRPGVGSGTMFATLGLRPVSEKVVLSGVPMEASEPSGLDIESVLCFKLNDDLFFLMPRADGFDFGEPGARPDSFDTAWFRAGVAGEEVSAGLGSTGSGDGAASPVC